MIRTLVGRVLLRLLSGRAPTHQAVPTPPRQRFDLNPIIDGRPCDRHALERLVEKLEQLFGPLPRERLTLIRCGPTWIRVVFRSHRGHSITLYRAADEAEARIVRVIMPWWEASGLESEEAPTA